MQRLLIAENSEVITTALADALGGAFALRSCCDGCEALELLHTFRPDALILNLHLPRKDGFTLLRQAAWLPNIILAISHQSGSFVPQTAAALGAGRLLVMPTVDSVISNLMDMLCQTQEVPDPRAKTLRYLHELGFHANLDGYKQLLMGIPLFAEDPHQVLSKELYPAIAMRLGFTDGRTVEHSIRHAIEDAWRGRDDAVWRKYFPADSSGEIPCPNNKLFLSALAQMLEK